jgi:hypothetical protein
VRAAGAATHGDSAAAAAHPLALLSSAAAHRLLRHGCISHAGTHTARALARSLLQRNSISAAACPELLPAILPTAADADDDGSALDALAAFVSRAADIAESELVSVVRVLLPRARAERLLACQAVASHAGAPTDRPTAVAAAAAAAASDPAEAAGGARNARARACVLLARVCVCAKSDEPLLDALADLRVDEATELIAQLTGASLPPARLPRSRLESRGGLGAPRSLALSTRATLPPPFPDSAARTRRMARARSRALARTRTHS